MWLKPADAERDPITIGIWLGSYTLGSGEVFGQVPGLVDAFSILGIG